MTDAVLAQLTRLVPNIPLTVVSQGAEALVLSTETHPYYPRPGHYVVKYRPPKPYRHPKIDSQITRSRTAGEVKFMVKLRRVGIRAPTLISVDSANGLIWMEGVGQKLPNGTVSSLKNLLWYLESQLRGEEETEEGETENIQRQVEDACRKTGALIGKLHMFDMVHGDLTTSNILLEHGDAVLIDFGLSGYSSLAEDKAVDLYVLERAVLSTHSLHALNYNRWLLQGYQEEQCGAFASTGGKKKYTDTLRKLDDI